MPGHGSRGPSELTKKRPLPPSTSSGELAEKKKKIEIKNASLLDGRTGLTTF
jgi:hypothetical protein